MRDVIGIVAQPFFLTTNDDFQVGFKKIFTIFALILAQREIFISPSFPEFLELVEYSFIFTSDTKKFGQFLILRCDANFTLLIM